MGESWVQIPICSASVLLSIRTIPVSRTHQHQITQPWLRSPAWVIKLLDSGMGLGACRQPARAPGNSYPRSSTPVQSGMNFPFHQQPSGVCDPGLAAVSRLHSSALKCARLLSDWRAPDSSEWKASLPTQVCQW